MIAHIDAIICDSWGDRRRDRRCDASQADLTDPARTNNLTKHAPSPLRSKELFDAPLQKLIQLAQAYLFLQPQSTIMARFIIEFHPTM